jgi:putative serine protease PepD
MTDARDELESPGPWAARHDDGSSPAPEPSQSGSHNGVSAEGAWWSRPSGDPWSAPPEPVQPPLAHSQPAEATAGADRGWPAPADADYLGDAPQAFEAPSPHGASAWGQPAPQQPSAAHTPYGSPSGLAPAEPAYSSSLPWGPRPSEADTSRRRTPRTWLVVALAAAIAVVAGTLGGVAALWVNDQREDPLIDGNASLGATVRGTTERDAGTVAGVAARLLPSVVSFEVRTAGGRASGSGFVIREDGYILTNNHVIRPAADGDGTITVTFNDGSEARARIVGRDDSYDLAVVKVRARNLPVVSFGDSEAIVAGDSVLAIGSPLGLSGTVTSGIVSALDRPVTAGETADEASFISAVQTDAAINPGNSGGPLVNLRAEVIGVNSAIATLGPGSGVGGETGSIGLGFAIPMNQARVTAEQLITRGYATHPVIGVALDPNYNGEGARVAGAVNSAGAPVRPGGPADLAGIRPGDVITEIDGRPVQGSQELIVAIRSMRPGDVVELTYERRGREREATVTLGESEPPEE